MSDKLAINGGEPVRTKPYPPWPFIYDDEREEVEKVLKEHAIHYWMGERGKTFEKNFAEYCGVKHGMVVSNGTTALHVAMAAAGVGPGDEVIVPGRTFIASALGVLHQNAIPIFADVDINTQCLSAETVAPHITDRTRAIVAVDLTGHPCDMDPIMELAKERDLVVIEDAAQAHGAEYKGRKTCSLGHIAAISFCQNKHFTTGGEGGMVLTDSDEMADIAKGVRTFGLQEGIRDGQSVRLPGNRFIGSNYRMSEMQSAIGLKALEKLDWNVGRRRESAAYLTERLSAHEELITPYEAPDCKHSYFYYYLRLRLDKLTIARGEFIKAVEAEGVPCGSGSPSELYKEKLFQEMVGYGHTQCPFKCPWYQGEVDYSQVSLPNCKQLGLDALFVPVHATIEQDDLDDTIQAIEKVLDACRK